MPQLGAARETARVYRAPRDLLPLCIDMPDINRIKFRIGVNLGDVIVEEHDIFGDGVNVAARLYRRDRGERRRWRAREQQACVRWIASACRHPGVRCDLRAGRGGETQRASFDCR
jgi:hypothetical protein